MVITLFPIGLILRITYQKEKTHLFLFVSICEAFLYDQLCFVVMLSGIQTAMRERSNGLRGMASSAKVGTHDKRGSSAAHVNNHHQHQNAKTNNDDANNNHHHQGAGGGGSASPETAHDSKKGGGGGGGGSSSGSEALPMVWPPKFVIGLTNKEKEEDFMAIKGSKLPQRPKKRAKFIQRTLNVSFYFSPFFSIITFYFYSFLTIFLLTLVVNGSG